MTNLHLKGISDARAERAEYIASLTEVERVAFLSQVLECGGPATPGFPTVDNDFQNVDGIPPDEQSLEIEDASEFASKIRLVDKRWAHKGNWRSACGCDGSSSCTTSQHGTSWISVDYNSGIGRGAFDIIVYVRHYGREYFGSRNWDLFVNCPAAYKLWKSARLFGPGSPGREGHFSTGNNQTYGPHTGTLGVAAYLPGTETIAWTGRWYFDEPSPGHDWGNEWLHCGKEYAIWLADE